MSNLLDELGGPARDIFRAAKAVNGRVESVAAGLDGGDLVVAFLPAEGEVPLDEAEIAALREALRPGPRVRFVASSGVQTFAEDRNDGRL